MLVTQKIESAKHFDELFADNYAAVTRLIYRVVGDIGWAEGTGRRGLLEITPQSTRVGRQLSGLVVPHGPATCVDNLRKRKRRTHYEALAPAPGALQSPEQTISQNEQAAQVRQVLAALKPEQAGLLVLRSEGCSLKEIASILDPQPGLSWDTSRACRRGFQKGVREPLWTTLTRKRSAGGSRSRPPI